MILRHLCKTIGKRGCPKGDVNKPGKQVFQPEPAVEAVAELRQIAGKMFLPNGMVGTVNGILDVAQHRVDPEKSGILDAVRPSSRYLGLVGIARPGHSPEGGQSVGDYRAVRGKMLPGPGVDLVSGEPPDPGEAKPEGTPFFGALDRRQERRFSGSPPAPCQWE